MADETQDEFIQTYGVSKEVVAQQREAHEAKSATDLAYEAGRHASRDDYVHEHGLDACPFSDGDERQAWLTGLREGLAKRIDIRDLHEAVSAEVDNAN